MLGYVKIYKPDMKVREYEIYNGYYCGICKYIGSRYGQLPRMSLSYDAAFLAVLLDSVDAEPDRPTKEHCIVHHINKRPVVRNKSIEYAGDLMLILAWYKLLDDAHDEGKTSAKAASLLLRRQYRKLSQKHPALCKGIAEHLAELSALEEAKCDSIDAAAEAFAKIMEVIFREGSTNLHETFAEIGYHMGKWIYLIDALDDIEENIESGAYNPLLYRFDFQGRVSGDPALADETPEEFRQRIRERMEFNLYHYLAVLGEKIECLDIQKNKGIIENVIYFGMNRTTEEILEHKETNNNQKEDLHESI
ncbi:MAG: hypothetical protein IJI74_06260 [Firmicutes bacterium]|nr:hypothetical protein [Bacillota bacterium]